MDATQYFKLPAYGGSSVNFTIDWNKIQPGKKYAVTCFSNEDYSHSGHTNITFTHGGSPHTTSGGLFTQQQLDDIMRQNAILRKQLENSEMRDKLHQLALGGAMIILL